MMKSNNLILMLPMLINILIIYLMTIPTKLNKFHPLSFLLILVMITCLICLLTNYFYKSWFNYIMFLTMIGGLMIIFMYITSLSNNELFFMNFYNIKMSMIKSIMIMSLMIFILMFKEINFFNFNFKLMELLMNEQLNMNYMYMKLYNKSTIFLMIYLYYTMIIIVNICYKYKSPLRQISFYV